ncbi:hypothetical protein RvY_10579 [Ramazzottius varieornatus]|uniref:Tetraspanin n=1 Tax=Ramazzottius varieornatus TaxID=947166 RepID=A0A1D1VD90_RAMVA|nr:hypothetical protein RvY_10579 [Ramazzottius varieornatus]
MTNSFAAIKAGNSTGQLDKALWDRLQDQLHCCGVRNYNDWLSNNLKIPDSCCRDKSRPNCAELSADTKRVCDRPDNVDICPIFTKGCLDTAEDYAKDNIGTVGGIGFGIAAFQVLGVVLAACLARKIREDSEL